MPGCRCAPSCGSPCSPGLGLGALSAFLCTITGFPGGPCVAGWRLQPRFVLSRAVAWLCQRPWLAGVRGRDRPHQQSSSLGTGPRMSPPRGGLLAAPSPPAGPRAFAVEQRCPSPPPLLHGLSPQHSWALLGWSCTCLLKKTTKNNKNHHKTHLAEGLSLPPECSGSVWVDALSSPLPRRAAARCPVASSRSWLVAGRGRAHGAGAGTSPWVRAAPGAGGGLGAGSSAPAVPSPPGMRKAITRSPESRICWTHPWLVSWVVLGLVGVFIFFSLPLGSLKPANLLLALGGAQLFPLLLGFSPAVSSTLSVLKLLCRPLPALGRWGGERGWLGRERISPRVTPRAGGRTDRPI